MSLKWLGTLSLWLKKGRFFLISTESTSTLTPLTSRPLVKQKNSHLAISVLGAAVLGCVTTPDKVETWPVLIIDFHTP